MGTSAPARKSPDRWADAVTWNEFWERLKRAQGSRRPSIHLPFGLMRAQAAVLEKLPSANPHAGMKIDLEPLQVVGKNDAITGKTTFSAREAVVANLAQALMR